MKRPVRSRRKSGFYVAVLLGAVPFFVWSALRRLFVTRQ